MRSNFQNLLKKFKKLNLPDGRYAIYGSGPLAVRKIRESKDLDVVVTDNLWQKLTKKYPIDTKRVRIRLREIEIYPAWAWEPKINGLEEMIKRAELIDDLRFIRLDDLIKCKRKMDGQKHAEDIELIKDYLKRKY